MLHPLIVPPQGLQFLIKYSFVPMIVRRDNFMNRKAVRFFNVTIWFESRSKPYHLPSKFYQTETKTDMITLSCKESVQWLYKSAIREASLPSCAKQQHIKWPNIQCPAWRVWIRRRRNLNAPHSNWAIYLHVIHLHNFNTEEHKYKINVVKVSKANYCLLVSFPRGLIAPRKT